PAFTRMKACLDIHSYVFSAMEHGVIEQLQSSNLVASSTVKMLLLNSTNSSRKVFLANSGNWTTGSNLRNQLANYTSSDLSDFDGYIGQGKSILLPQDGKVAVAGSGTWAGYGAAVHLDTSSSWSMLMRISGGYNGGYASISTATANPG